MALRGRELTAAVCSFLSSRAAGERRWLTGWSGEMSGSSWGRRGRRHRSGSLPARPPRSRGAGRESEAGLAKGRPCAPQVPRWGQNQSRIPLGRSILEKPERGVVTKGPVRWHCHAHPGTGRCPSLRSPTLLVAGLRRPGPGGRRGQCGGWSGAGADPRAFPAAPPAQDGL